MKERTKKRIWEFIGGGFLLSIGVGDWILAVRQNFRMSFGFGIGEIEVNQPLFYLFHIGAIVIGAGTIYMAFRPEKYVLRVCPKCQTDTQQFVSKVKYSERRREWTCETCHTKNSEPLPDRKAVKMQ